MNENRELALGILQEGFVLVFTGAGISTASGIPDYRGPDGVWKKFAPKDFTIESFLADPERYWSMRMDRKKAGFNILNAEPNKAHYAITEMQKKGIVREIITQNTDGLHQKADSQRVIELHGNASQCVCTKCGRKYPSQWAEDVYERTSSPAKCSACNVVLKPDVVLFGEKPDSLNLELATQAATNCRSVLVIGTTASVFPASMIPRVAKRTGARLIEVNEEKTDLTENLADVTLIGNCIEILPDLAAGLDRQLREKRGKLK